MDDLALWFQVSNHVYGENLLDTYPAAKKAMTSEVWESLPNEYSDNYVTNGNTKWIYQKAIVSLLPDNEKSTVLNHIDRIENSKLLPYSSIFRREDPRAVFHLRSSIACTGIMRASPGPSRQTPVTWTPMPLPSYSGETGMMMPTGCP